MGLVRSWFDLTWCGSRLFLFFFFWIPVHGGKEAGVSSTHARTHIRCCLLCLYLFCFFYFGFSQVGGIWVVGGKWTEGVIYNFLDAYEDTLFCI